MKSRNARVKGPPNKIPLSPWHAFFLLIWPLNTWWKKAIFITLIVIVGWYILWTAFSERTKTAQHVSSQSTTGNKSPAIVAGGNVTIVYDAPPELSKPDISIGVALYAYEKAFILREEKKTYYMEMRNLVSNCSIYRAEVKDLPRGRAEVPRPSAWILIKLRLENISPVPLTNVRLGVRGLPLSFSTIGCTPNAKASLSHEFTMNKGLGTYVIVVEALAPNDTAIVTLQNEIDRKGYMDSSTASSHTIVFPFVVSNQFRATGLKIIKFDASELLKQEAYLFTGERTIINEKIDYRLLGPNEPSIVEELTKYEPLPPANECPTGTAGHW